MSDRMFVAVPPELWQLVVAIAARHKNPLKLPSKTVEDDRNQ